MYVVPILLLRYSITASAIASPSVADVPRPEVVNIVKKFAEDDEN